MTQLYLLQAFFNEAQKDRFIEALLAVLIATPPVLTTVSLYLQFKMRQDANETKQVVKSNAEKLDRASVRAPRRATDDPSMEASGVQEVPPPDVD